MGILAVVPVIDSAYISIYGAISLYFLTDLVSLNLCLGVLFVFIHFYVAGVVDGSMLDFGNINGNDVGGVNGMLVGMSFLLGVDVFGFPEGLLVGPFIVSSVPMVVHSILNSK